MTCLIALCLWLQGGLCLCWEHSHVNLLVLLNHDMSWVPCACDCKVVFVFAGCIAMSVCKFYSIMTWFECPVPATARWSVSLLGAQSCQFLSSWVPLSALSLWLQGCLCLCWVHSHVNCKFYSIMTCLECPVPVTARLSVSLLGAQPCQFASSTQSWHVLSALCLQGCLCLYWVHSHVNLQVLLNHDFWVPCACDCKVVCVFTGSTVMSICKFYSIMTCLTALCLRLQGGLCLCRVHSHVNF